MTLFGHLDTWLLLLAIWLGAGAIWIIVDALYDALTGERGTP